jgi:hypothetical protein
MTPVFTKKNRRFLKVKMVLKISDVAIVITDKRHTHVRARTRTHAPIYGPFFGKRLGYLGRRYGGFANS